jgi:hypothetical protein
MLVLAASELTPPPTWTGWGWSRANKRGPEIYRTPKSVVKVLLVVVVARPLGGWHGDKVTRAER